MWDDEADVGFNDLQCSIEVSLPELVDPKPLTRQNALSRLNKLLSSYNGDKCMEFECIDLKLY